jgi:hypothetical protein
MFYIMAYEIDKNLPQIPLAYASSKKVTDYLTSPRQYYGFGHLKNLVEFLLYLQYPDFGDN